PDAPRPHPGPVRERDRRSPRARARPERGRRQVQPRRAGGLMDHLVIEGLKPYDGRYEFDLGQELTTREWGWIKRLSGYLPANLDEDAWSDPELVCVLALIMLNRAGKVDRAEVPELFERFQDVPTGAAFRIEVGTDDLDEREDDAGPPASSDENAS